MPRRVLTSRYSASADGYDEQPPLLLFLCHSRKTSSAKKHITYRSSHPLPEMVVRSGSRIIASGRQSRSRKSAQDDKWNFCLTGASRTDHRRVFRRPPEELVHPLRRLAGHVQCDDIASLSSETKRRKAAGVRRIVIPGRPWQIGATPGGHTGNPVVQEVLILRGFLEAALKWRRGRDSNPSSYNSSMGILHNSLSSASTGTSPYESPSDSAL
jgi:hypothetical protein